MLLTFKRRTFLFKLELGFSWSGSYQTMRCDNNHIGENKDLIGWLPLHSKYPNIEVGLLLYVGKLKLL